MDQPQRAYETTRTAEDIKEELEAVARGAVDYRDGAIVYEPFEGQEDRIERLMEMLKDAKPSIATKITDYSTLSLTSRVEGNLYNDENIPVASILIKACGGIDDDKRESQVLIRSNKDAKIISDHPSMLQRAVFDFCMA